MDDEKDDFPEPLPPEWHVWHWPWWQWAIVVVLMLLLHALIWPV